MKSTSHTLALLLSLAAAIGVGCDSDGAVDGPLGPCDGPGATLLECPAQAIENAEDICMRLVRCGLVPLEEADFDWGACVALVESLPNDRFDHALDCFAVTGCDELAVDGTLNRNNLPLCLQFGDQ